MQSLLEPRGFAVLRMRSGKQLLEHVACTVPDLLLINAELADTSGVSLCQALSERGLLDLTTPVFLLTSTHWNRGERLVALRAGAWECLPFPYGAEELLARIDRYVAARMAADQQREISLIESETGLYSVGGIVRRARELGMYAIRHHRALGCAAFGIGGEWGSADPAGPAADAGRISPGFVTAFAGALTEVVRTSDVVGRLSRSEFILLAPDAGASGILELAGRVLEAVQARVEESHGNVRVRAGCYAVSDCAESLAASGEIIAHATAALRKACLDSSPTPILFAD